MSLVVDASVLVEILLQTPTGRAVQGRLRHTRPRAPDIIDAEVGAALRRAQRKGVLTDRQLGHALDRLRDCPGRRIPTRLLIGGSRRWWGSISAYDSLYLALASAAGASVLTCDGRLSRAPGTGVPIENVRVI